MSGTKASNQQRTSKKAAEFVLRQRVPAHGGYAQGWNAACESLAQQIMEGRHLEPPVAIEVVVRPPGKDHMERVEEAVGHGLKKASAAGVILQPKPDGAVENARCGKDGCIHKAGHVELGQPLHSDGKRTWRDRK